MIRIIEISFILVPCLSPFPGGTSKRRKCKITASNPLPRHRCCHDRDMIQRPEERIIRTLNRQDGEKTGLKSLLLLHKCVAPWELLKLGPKYVWDQVCNLCLAEYTVGPSSDWKNKANWCYHHLTLGSQHITSHLYWRFGSLMVWFFI